MAITPNNLLKINSTALFPAQVTFENLLGVFKVGLTTRWFTNSLIVTGITTVFTLLFQAMAGYAFAKMKFRGRKVLYSLTLAGLMVPKEALFIPLFLMFSQLSAHNTYAALFLPRIAIPLGVFIMVQFFKGIPDSLTEAAQIDGASPIRTFFSIILPMTVPALTSLGIFTYILTWNDYLWPLVSATRKEMFTITTGLASLQGNFAQATELGSLMARGSIASLPLLILFLIFQKYLIRGISMSSGGK
ncbi:multiple sugar transport system permease protein [Spirochaeta isovalerica]|uniref:Multiple sugar transport system permease protein n=2 Tax=Spirochaeta isovalerica TaxID=150 RepID=A0A841RBD0_9SPIO|nr:multiple sugar transport system permease protein [Spirochaeta isovalerica]